MSTNVKTAIAENFHPAGVAGRPIEKLDSPTVASIGEARIGDESRVGRCCGTIKLRDTTDGTAGKPAIINKSSVICGWCAPEDTGEIGRATGRAAHQAAIVRELERTAQKAKSLRESAAKKRTGAWNDFIAAIFT